MRSYAWLYDHSSGIYGKNVSCECKTKHPWFDELAPKLTAENALRTVAEMLCEPIPQTTRKNIVTLLLEKISKGTVHIPILERLNVPPFADEAIRQHDEKGPFSDKPSRYRKLEKKAIERYKDETMRIAASSDSGKCIVDIDEQIAQAMRWADSVRPDGTAETKKKYCATPVTPARSLFAYLASYAPAQSDRPRFMTASMPGPILGGDFLYPDRKFPGMSYTRLSDTITRIVERGITLDPLPHPNLEPPLSQIEFASITERMNRMYVQPSAHHDDDDDDMPGLEPEQRQPQTESVPVHHEWDPDPDEDTQYVPGGFPDSDSASDSSDDDLPPVKKAD